MPPPTPRSTLFPYTTLFRSERSEVPRRLDVGLSGVPDRVRLYPQPSLRQADADLRRGQLSERLDRKSTRLNSSHGYISYAVFCLKKKKLQNMTSGRAAERMA